MRGAGPAGGDVHLIEVATEQAALDMLSRSLHEIVRDGGVRSDDVAVLLGRPPERSFVGRKSSVGAFRLALDDGQVAAGQPNTIRISSIHRFKGLERRVVILMDAEGISEELMYVALTRARAHLVVIGSAATLARVRAEEANVVHATG
jgi:superfamily I DNA and RNA helicase